MPCFLKFQRNNQQPDSGMESASEKLEKKAVFPSYCGCERSTSEMKQSHLMAEPKYILGRHDIFCRMSLCLNSREITFVVPADSPFSV